MQNIAYHIGQKIKMNKIQVLFLIHDLGNGGAEKVLVNLVNHIDKSKFDITVVSLFGGGINERFLSKDIRYFSIFKRMIPGNSKLMKLFSPRLLHKICVKNHYDIEVAYLEGPSVRVISGCDDKSTRLVSWIHTRYLFEEQYFSAFRNPRESFNCYNRFDFTAFVSKDVGESFCKCFKFKKKCGVLYNTIESDTIRKLSQEQIPIEFSKKTINLLAVGTLKPVKGYDRLISVTKKLLTNGYSIHTYILGKGPLEKTLKKVVLENELNNNVTFLGYDANPYKYMANCDLFVCSSITEGFSTATTEALIVGVPVCTVDVSGMREILGDNNQFGIITENSEEGLYNGIKCLLDSPNLLMHYREQAKERGMFFNTENTVRKVESLFYKITKE